MKKKMVTLGWRNVLGMLLCWGLCGCYDVKDEVVIRADGSGEVRVETLKFEKDDLRNLEGMMASRLGLNGPMFVYPPTDRGEGKKFFPGKGFTVTEEWKREAEGYRLIVKAEFKDVRTLLESPYARSRGMSIQVTNGEVVFRATSGFQPQSKLMELNLEELKGRNNPYWTMMKSKSKQGQELVQRLRGEFSVQLPKPAESKKTGIKKSGDKIAWVVARGDWTNVVQFAEAAEEVVEVRCSAEGIAWKGSETPAMGVVRFADLPPGLLNRPDRTPDLEVVKSKARFEPYALQVTRSVNLAGENHGLGDEGGVLVGGVELEEEYRPDRWGPLKLKSAKDGTGKSLVPEEDRMGEDDLGMTSQFGWGSWGMDMGDDEEGTESANMPAHWVSLRLASPDSKAEVISEIKAVLPMHFYASRVLVKLTNAITAKQISSRSGGEEGEGDSVMIQDNNSRAVKDSVLSSIGVKMVVRSVRQNGLMFTVMFDLVGELGMVEDGVVYDADGRPFPTFLAPGWAGRNAMQLQVIGKPKPPLSIGLILKAALKTLELPVAVENVALDR